MQKLGQNRNPDNASNGFNIGNSDLIELIQDVLAQGSVFQFTATGSSMSPFIRSGDTLKIASLDGKRPLLGQVLAFLNPHNQKLMVHRLVAKKDSSWILRGDSYGSQSRDIVPTGSLLGVVTNIERSGTPIHFGLGFERVPIALLSRYHLLLPLMQALRTVKHKLQKKTKLGIF